MKILPFAKRMKRLTENYECSNCGKRIIFDRFDFDSCTLKYGGTIFSYGYCDFCHEENRVLLNISSIEGSLIEEKEAEDMNVSKTMFFIESRKK